MSTSSEDLGSYGQFLERVRRLLPIPVRNQIKQHRFPAPHQMPADLLADIRGSGPRPIISDELLDEIEDYPSIWENPSEMLLFRTDPQEVGIIQVGHTDFERVCYLNEEDWQYCNKSFCANCNGYGYPCSNMCYYGHMNPVLDCRWTYGAKYGFMRAIRDAWEQSYPLPDYSDDEFVSSDDDIDYCNDCTDE